jgi:hypothetical protein
MQDLPSKKRYSYSAYGLNIKSDVSLPELVKTESGEAADVEIRFKRLDDVYLNTELNGATTFERPGCIVRVSANAVCYSWNGIGTALIQNGSEVIISTASGIDNVDMAPFITGAILGNLLDQRGLMVLHGSAVAVEGKAIAFLGEKGAGKSTFALHLQKRGYSLVTDDLVPIAFSGDEVQTIPGFPRIRLWTDAVRSVGLDPAAMPKINKFVDKRSYGCTDGFSREPVNLGRIYILSEDSTIGIDQLEPSQAFIELTRNTYLNRYLGATGKSTEHFRKCEALVALVPIFRLRRPHDFSLLPELSSAVVEHRL